MSLFSFSAALLTLAALFSYLNARFLRQPAGIMFLLLGVLAAGGVLAGGRVVPGFTDTVRAVGALRGAGPAHPAATIVAAAAAAHAGYSELGRTAQRYFTGPGLVG